MDTVVLVVIIAAAWTLFAVPMGIVVGRMIHQQG